MAQVTRGQLTQFRLAGSAAVLQGRPAGSGRAQNQIQSGPRFGYGQGNRVGESGGEGNQPGTRQRRVHEPGDGRLGGAAAQGGQGGISHIQRHRTSNIER